MKHDVAKLTELLPFLEQIGARAKKSLSQNFLVDSNILRKIVATAAPQPDELIIEIGPGPGALTEILLKEGVRIVAIEKDALFAKALERLQTQYPEQLTIFCQDITTFDIETVISPLLTKNKKAKVIANLPYQLTSTILAQFLPLHALFSSLTFMVQHEVAMRIVAKACSCDYSSLTIFANFYSTPSYAFKVSNSCFYPVPKVDSAIVQFKLQTPPNVEQVAFFALTRLAFQHKRKMLRASLRTLYPLPDILTALQQCNLTALARPQELSLQQFVELFQRLHK